MSDYSNVIVGVVGVLGTLAATALTLAFTARAEARRRLADNQQRWLSDRRRVGGEIVGLALKIERGAWDVAAFLDRDDREHRLPGYSTILLTPEEGLPDVLGATERELLVEAVEAGFRQLDDLEHLTADFALIASPAEAQSATELLEALWNVIGHLEAFSLFEIAADAVDEARAKRKSLVAEIRRGLGVQEL